MPRPVTELLPHLTAALPGTGGTIKQRPEDFLVEELPLYEPKGVGEHLVLYIEKRGQTTSDVVRRLAKMFHVSRRDIGYAGLKDKHAITRQHVSIHLPDSTHEDKYLSRFEFTPFDLLWSQRHNNKLRRGHLAGNRFVIYVRNVAPTAVLAAKTVLDRLVQTGIPNYLGWQRFGYRQCNHVWGLHLLKGNWQALMDSMLGGPLASDSESTRQGRTAYDRGDYATALDVWPRQLRHDRHALDTLRQGKSARAAAEAMDFQQREFLVSALQSAIFNQVLAQRIRDGLFNRLVNGDLAWKHDRRCVFAVDEAAAVADNHPDGRVAKLEVAPSGPMWGQGMIKPTDKPLEWELAALKEIGLTEADFEQANHVKAEGSRRSMTVELKEPDISSGADQHGPYLRLAFTLPRGSFATTVLREIMKLDGPPRKGDTDDEGDSSR